MSDSTGQIEELDILRIMELIPHRYPMLLVDKVRDIVPGQSATGVKNVTMNEPHFQGHFPQRPIMPGVLIVEAMAQTAAVLVVHTLGDAAHGKLVYFMTINDARFRRPVTPGDQLLIEVAKEQSRGSVWRFAGKAMVNGTVMAEATFSAMIADK